MVANRSGGIIEENAGLAVITDFLLAAVLPTELCINAFQNIYKTQTSSLLTSPNYRFSKHLDFRHSVNKTSG